MASPVGAFGARETPAVFSVNTLVDENNGFGVGHVSLREATAEANARLWADAIQFACYNFCRVHMSIRCTPATAAGLTEQPWSLQRLLEEAGRE
jgi:hypothetical protein